MEDVQIYTKHEIFRPRAALSIGLLIATALPLLYTYFLLASIDPLHPLQYIFGSFGAAFTTLLYWPLTAILLISCLAYRATYYKVTNEKLASPATSISLVLTRRALLTAAAHCGCSFLLACVLTSMVGGRYADLIMECQSSQRCLNEHKWFVLLFSALTGVVFSLEMSASGGYCIDFSRKEKPVMHSLKDVFPSLLKSSTRAVRRAIMVYYPAYLLFGSSTVWVVRSCLFLHADLQSGLRTWWDAFDPALLYQAYVAGVFIRLTWTLSLFYFQTCLCKSARFELSESRVGESLLSALELKEDSLAKMLAFKDLASMANTYEDTRRQTVFSLSMPGGHPKIWQAVLSVTKGSLTELLSRIQASNETLLSAHKDNISHQVSKIETIKPGFSEGKSGSAKPESIWNRLPILHKQFPDHLAGKIFHDGQKHIWSLLALSSLVTRSATEDKYGIVQQNMGEIVTLLLNMHQATDKLFKLAPALTKLDEFKGMNNGSHLLGLELRKQTRLALETIATTFLPHISHISGLGSDQVKQLCNFA